MKNTLVVKYGGNAMKSLGLRRAVAAEIAALRTQFNVVVVHGGGPVIERDLARLGIASEFLRGLRVTSPEAMDAIEASLTKLCKELSQDIGQAIGLTGRDMGLLQAEALEDTAYGRVGRVTGVNVALLQTLLGVGLTPVVGCVALDATGECLNINADWAAGSVAGALGAPVVFLTDVPGVMQNPSDPSTLARRLNTQEVTTWIASGVISGGMVPKVESATKALAAGAPSATIASGMQAGVLLEAAQGLAGTTIVLG